ncbi:MAG TPA: GspH/FimT family pseudopilin [Steroidobacteraceae bacterium]|nr:GspH/FimT family pseudopilin [Steroidobacteraceae bacterium]
MDVLSRRERGCRARAGGVVGRHRGFTVLELMVVVGIAAVLATLAVPSFGSLRRAAGLSAATNQLLWALHFARSAAVLNGQAVTLCLSADDATCVGSAAASARGWLVFYQSSGPSAVHSSGQPDPGNPLLHSFQLPVDVAVHGSRAAVTFWPVTRASSTSTFDLCSVGASAPGRAVVVSQTGRPRVAVEQALC